MTIAVGGDCLADAAVLRAQPGLAGGGRLGLGDFPAGRRAGRGGAAGTENDPRSPRRGPGAGLGARRGPRTWRG